MAQPAETSTIQRSNTPRGRLLGIDVLRALAIMGMVWSHFTIGSWAPVPANAPAPDMSAAGAFDTTAWQWITIVLGLRPRDIFFVLAGLTVALGTGGFRRYRGRELFGSWRKLGIRAVFLFVVGLSLGQAGFGGVEILTYYTLWIIILMPFTVLGARPLLWCAGVFSVVTPVVKILLNNAGMFDPSMHDMRLMDDVSGFALLVHPEAWGPFFKALVFGSGGVTQDTIAILPFLFLGLALGRLDLRDHATRVRMAVWGAAVGVGALVVGLVSPALIGSDKAFAASEKSASPDVPWQSLLSHAAPGPTTPYFSIVDCVMVAGLITALLGAFLMLMERTGAKRFLWPVAAFGSMSLTWYCVHFLVTGNGTPLGFIPTGNARNYLLFIAGALIVSVVWRRFFTRGPLEWLQHVAVTRLSGRVAAP
ncbi:acyltransferase family protein [Aeromicrobium fastidiosum]|uniref:DUF418 domain-containing protein n=1 Tax=Aeromicrobium fastidiosum TaxID=52699 RepID=A0A641AKA8_9ACTN|nr:acyltransferase family protein [Aeromicrobium fastidiosum]KAA1376271.1 DUF418 domain-containing protein [Aeromicrobium fastidiosum]MBP2391834.1 putative membrane protein YeiB [Aeromicrobium fastidiosum]